MRKSQQALNANACPNRGRLVSIEKLGNVKLWLLHDLDLSNHAVLERENTLALLLNLFPNHFRDQLFDLVQIAGVVGKSQDSNMLLKLLTC